MAPLTAQNLTTRWYFDYITGSDAVKARRHTAMVRTAFDSTATSTDVQNKFLSVLNAIGPGGFRLGWTITGVRRSAANTTFSVPVTVIAGLAAFTGTVAYTAWVLSAEAIELRFQGRSPTTGVKTHFSLYGVGNNSIADFRATTSESTGITNVVTVLNAASAPLLVAGDNTVPVWYPYGNYNYNSYWEGELRT